jgi:hypothetical protein
VVAAALAWCAGEGFSRWWEHMVDKHGWNGEYGSAQEFRQRHLIAILRAALAVSQA